jgi:hypothetical protein
MLLAVGEEQAGAAGGALVDGLDVLRYAESHGVNNRIAAYMLAIDRVASTIRTRGSYAWRAEGKSNARGSRPRAFCVFHLLPAYWRPNFRIADKPGVK